MEVKKMMARKSSLILIVCLYVLLFSVTMIKAADKKDYYPLTPGSEWVMQVTMLEDNSVIEQKITIDKPEVFEGVTYSVMRQIDAKNKWTVLILKNEKGVYWKKLSLNKFVTVDSYFNPQAPYLQYPVTKSSKWEWNGVYALPWGDKKSSMKFEIQNDAEEVTVPAGKFKCAKIHVIKVLDKDTDEETNWYAPGVGMVKYKSTKMLKELKSYNIK
jgi:hypothetical protein